MKLSSCLSLATLIATAMALPQGPVNADGCSEAKVGKVRVVSDVGAVVEYGTCGPVSLGVTIGYANSTIALHLSDPRKERAHADPYPRL